MEEESLASEQVTHADVLGFADKFKQENKSIKLINSVMLAIGLGKPGIIQ